MTCYSPLRAWRRRGGLAADGKWPITWSLHDACVDMPVEIACGQCVGCRLKKSAEWAARCMNEAQCHKDNCFITLTFDPEHVPVDGSLDKKVFQDFMKRFRKRFGKVRYFHCGEYGSKNGRPHYHAIIFGYDFSDKKMHTVRNGNILYTSKDLASLWPFGFSSVGSVTFESAAYVARYALKKITGSAAEQHYERVDLSTGEVFKLLPEYTTMSLKPGIGANWFKKFYRDVYPSDEIIVNGRPIPPPRYYDDLYEFEGWSIGNIKNKRVLKAKKHVDNQSTDRLIIRQVVKEAQIQSLKREVE